MIIYFVLLVLVLILPCKKGNLSEKYNISNRIPYTLTGSQLYVLFVIAMLVCIAGFRDYTVGIDLKHHYLRNFQTYAILPWNEISNFGIECGLFVLSKLIGSISVNGQLFIFTTSLLPLTLTIQFFYRNSDDFKLSTTLFITYCMMYQYMNQIAQSIALSIILFGYDYLKKDRLIPFLISVAVAMTFHTTAVIALLFILLRYFKITRKTIILFMGAAVVFMVGYSFFFDIAAKLLPQYAWYISSVQHGVGDTGLGVFLRIIMLGAVFFWSLYLAKYRNRMIQIQNVDFKLWMTYCAFIFQMITTRMIVMNRLGQYMLPFVLVFIPDCINSCGNNKKDAKIGILAFMIVYFSYMTIEWGKISFGVVPYQFFES